MRLGGTTPLVVSSSSTAESSSLEWESPVHSWHDLKRNKYKIALRNRQIDGIEDNKWKIIQNSCYEYAICGRGVPISNSKYAFTEYCFRCYPWCA